MEGTSGCVGPLGGSAEARLKGRSGGGRRSPLEENSEEVLGEESGQREGEGSQGNEEHGHTGVTQGNEPKPSGHI